MDRRYGDDEPRTATAVLKERRASNLDFLATVDPKRLDHDVELPRAGRLTGLDLLAAWVTHDRLHVAQVVATLARAGANRWAPLRTEYAGPIPYAGA